MSKQHKINFRSFDNPVGRWAAVGPYYAMFPLEFAFDIINRYSQKDDFIFDPFAGRGSSIFAGGVLQRKSLGIEINPVGWVYSQAKINTATDKKKVIDRLKEIYELRNDYKAEAKELPEFYKYCFSKDVIHFLLSAREKLKWERNKVDTTLMSIILVYLHNNIGQGLSNQMKQTKSMGPAYSIKWWKANGMSTPPKVDSVKLITDKLNWRYEKGTPEIDESEVILGDSTKELNRIVANSQKHDIKFSLLLTSPPYYSITDYHSDQWLRLWMLGGDTKPTSQNDIHKGRFMSKGNYKNLLDEVFGASAKMMANKSTVYVRTDAREFTLATTKEVLKKHFPNHRMKIVPKPVAKNKTTQTAIYGDKTKKKGEMDLILMRQ